jgi:putative flavoprotein involved in K+ transport
VTAPVVIVGAGQAGLAAAYCLEQRGIACLLLDAASEIGASWRTRYDSLKLFTPAQYCHLPGVPFPAPKDHYPTKDEVGAYLQMYAGRLRGEVRLDARVKRVVQSGQGYRIEIETQGFDAPVVVITHGAVARPWRPPFSAQLPGSVLQLHSNAYRCPGQLPPGDVLVVGAGNSGAQIAEELAQDRKVFLSFDRLPKRFPQRFLGRDIFWWLIAAGMMGRVIPPDRHVDAVVGAVPLIGGSLAQKLRNGAIAPVPRVVDAGDAGVICADGRTLCPSVVIWATGFRPDYSWIEAPVLDANGNLRQERGWSVSHGLTFLGLPGLHTKGSGFLGFVGADAEHLSERIAAYLAGDRRAHDLAASCA